MSRNPSLLHCSQTFRHKLRPATAATCSGWYTSLHAFSRRSVPAGCEGRVHRSGLRAGRVAIKAFTGRSESPDQIPAHHDRDRERSDDDEATTSQPCEKADRSRIRHGTHVGGRIGGVPSGQVVQFSSDCCLGSVRYVPYRPRVTWLCDLLFCARRSGPGSAMIRRLYRVRRKRVYDQSIL